MLKGQQLWDRLQRVRSVRFTSHGNTPRWYGSGVGSVAVESPSESVLIYRESGHWQPVMGHEMRFSNVFRWTLAGSGLIRLEHLRFGSDHPIFLVDVIPNANGDWSSLRPHLCQRDCYAAKLGLQESGVWVRWVVTGPKKSDRIEYSYSW